VHEAEHALYPECVRRYLEEPWRRERARIVWGEGAGFAAVRHRAPRAHAG
jgi:hypothetical protein